MKKDPRITDRSQHYVFTHVRSGYIYVAWNQKRSDKDTVFLDKRVRQAMTMLIDRERITKEIFLGFSDVANGPFHPEGPQYNEEVKTWPYSVERATKLLMDAGFTKDANGRMIRPDGKPFEIELVYPSGSDIYQQVVFFMEDNFAKAGIVLKLVPQKWVLLLKTLNEKQFDAIMLGWGAGRYRR